MPSFEIQADIFTRLSVFDSPKGSSNTFKTHKNISLYFKRRYLIIYNYFALIYSLCVLFCSFITSNNKNNVSLLENVIKQIQHSVFKLGVVQT